MHSRVCKRNKMRKKKKREGENEENQAWIKKEKGNKEKSAGGPTLRWRFSKEMLVAKASCSSSSRSRWTTKKRFHVHSYTGETENRREKSRAEAGVGIDRVKSKKEASFVVECPRETCSHDEQSNRLSMPGLRCDCLTPDG